MADPLCFSGSILKDPSRGLRTAIGGAGKLVAMKAPSHRSGYWMAGKISTTPNPRRVSAGELGEWASG